MLDQDDIEEQLTLLSTHRRTLAHLLQQAAQYGGEIFAPPQTANGIHEARVQIQRIKAALAQHGISIDDEEGDEAILPGRVRARLAALSPQEQRCQRRTLAGVRENWVKGVLEDSLHGAALIALGLETRQDALAYPWELVVKRPDQVDRPLAPGTTIVQVFDELGGEVLILGAPGAGKTTMLLELARALITRAERDEAQPIPAVFPLSLWAERRLSLAEWLTDELSNRYDVPPQVGHGWIESGRLLPLLDGLDEVHLDHRGACVQAINACRKEYGLNLAVCSRVTDYESLAERLRLRGAVLIQPLTQAQIDTYLDQAGEQLAALRADLQTDAALRELAETPLMLNIMMLTYQGQSPHLLDAPASLETRRQQLFEAYVHRMLAWPRSDTGTPPQRIVRWLAWLAHGMMELNLSVFYLEDLQPTWLTTRRQRTWYALGVGITVLLIGVFASTLSGTLAGLLVDRLIIGVGRAISPGPSFTLFGGLVGAVIGGLIAALIVRPINDQRAGAERVSTVERIFWSWDNAKRITKPSPYLWRGLLIGLVIGVAAALVIAIVGEPMIGFSSIVIRNMTDISGGMVLNNVIVSTLIGLCAGSVIWMLSALVGFIRALRSARPGSGNDIWRSISRRYPLIWDNRFSTGLAIGGAIGFVGKLGVTLGTTWSAGLAVGLAAGLLGGLIVWATSFLRLGIRYYRVASRVKVNQGIQHSARIALISGFRDALLGIIVGGLGGAMLGGLTAGLSGRLFGAVGGRLFESLLVALGGGVGGGALGGALIGAMLGLIFGLVYGLLRFGGKTCVQHATLRLAIWRSGGMPLRYVRFLDATTRRILLRRVGGGYIFIHRLMQKYFDTLDTLQPGAMLTSYPWGIVSRANDFWEKGRFDEALADLSLAIELAPQHAGTIAQRGRRYREIRRYDEALADFNQAVKFALQPDWAPAELGLTYTQRGIRFWEKGRFEEALADLSLAIEFAPQDAVTIARRGRLYRAMRRYDEALADFNRAIDLDSQDDWAITQRGITYHELRLYEEALADFNRAIELNPQRAWAITQRGVIYREMHRYEEALADFNRAIDLNAQDDWAIAQRGITHHKMRRYEEGLADFNRAIELDPQVAWVIARRGVMYREMKRYEEALADFNRTIELDSQYTWAIAQRGATHHQMRRYEEALVDFNRTIDLDPQFAWAIAQRGVTHQRMERYKEALTDLNRAIELDPKLAWTIARRGVTYREMGLYTETLADLQHALDLEPGLAWVIVERGITYRRMGRYEEALAELQRAIDLDPENTWAIGQRGMIYRRMGRYEEALANLSQAIELDPRLAGPFAQRGRIYRHMERYKEALADLDRAIELSPKSDWAIAERGYTYRQLGRYEEALADLALAIDLDPEKDRYRYMHALTSLIVGQDSSAQTSIALAIQKARQKYEQYPSAWPNTFNLALYYLASYDMETSLSLYSRALHEGASVDDVRGAIEDLDDFLLVFPENQVARAAHDMLLNHARGSDGGVNAAPVNR